MTASTRPLKQDLEQAHALAEQAGEVLLSWSGQLEQSDVGHKSASRDLVTAADVASEKLILAGLAELFPGQAVLAEESGSHPGVGGSGPRWCIDPLDGTVNFVHGLPMYAVSIARLDEDGFPELAVVHLPRLQESYVAFRGGGAWCGERRLSVSPVQTTEEAVLATGFPYRRHVLADNNLENFQRLFLHQRGVRRMGSAACDLAYVAAGKLDAFWELHLSPWDVAAGGLLVQEAGGVVETFRGSGSWVFDGNLFAGHAPVVEDMRRRLGANRGPEWPDLGDRA